jgi:hypothetical protein
MTTEQTVNGSLLAVVRLRLIHVLRASRAQLLLALLSAIGLRYGLLCLYGGHPGAASD